MSARLLHARDAAPGTAAAWAVSLGAALDGSGPALTPLPAGPAAVRTELLEAFRPDDAGAPLESDEVALVVPTSGSTGAAKGALLTAAALLASAAATHARLGGVGRWVLALPLTHVAGLMVVVRSLAGGQPPTEVSLADGFDPLAFGATTTSAAAAARADGLPLYASLVPTQLRRCLDAGVDLSAYTALLVGAAAAPAPLLARAARRGARVVTTYGMSETCGGCVYDGVPLDGVGVSFDADGRVLLSGPTLFTGYRLRPDLTRAALDGRGRFVTSDLGHVDDGGLLRIDGRADDVIISGGENVVPAQVEAAIADLPDVQACAVVGVADPEWGERVVALVAWRPGGRPLDLAALRARLAGRLAPAALPRDLVALDAFPLLATGKPDRSTLRRLAAGDYAGPHPTHAEES